MKDLLVLIHTVPPLIDVFNRLVPRVLPGIEVKHILDEPLLETVRRRGDLAAEDGVRLGTHVEIAEKLGARAVLVTCSTVSPLVDDLRTGRSLKVLKIDEIMISRAVQAGRKIHVLATNPTTLGPTRLLLEQQARQAGKEIQIREVLIENALSLLLAGEGDAHDRLVCDAIVNKGKDADVIVLAQASMARVLDSLPEEQRPAPVFSSPHLALQSLIPIYQPDTN